MLVQVVVEMADGCAIPCDPCPWTGSEDAAHTTLSSVSSTSAFCASSSTHLSSHLYPISSFLSPSIAGSPPSENATPPTLCHSGPSPLRQTVWNGYSHVSLEPYKADALLRNRAGLHPSASQPRPGAPAATAAVPALAFGSRVQSSSSRFPLDVRGSCTEAPPIRNSSKRPSSSRSASIITTTHLASAHQGGGLSPTSSASIMSTSTVRSATRSRRRGAASGSVAKRITPSTMVDSACNAASSATSIWVGNGNAFCAWLPSHFLSCLQ
jgi:hypothetical protein